MKKLFFAAIIAVFSMTSAFAQDGVFAIGANVGFPTGDAGDWYSLSYGLDVNYLFEMGDALQVGAASGYSSMSGKTIEYGDSFGGVDLGSFKIPNFSYIPLAAAGRFNVSDEFVLGVDLGYAIGMGDNSKGGMYYRPMVGYGFGDALSANAYYTGISVTGGSGSLTLATFGVGIMYKLGM